MNHEIPADQLEQVLQVKRKLVGSPEHGGVWGVMARQEPTEAQLRSLQLLLYDLLPMLLYSLDEVCAELNWDLIIPDETLMFVRRLDPQIGPDLDGLIALEKDQNLMFSGTVSIIYSVLPQGNIVRTDVNPDQSGAGWVAKHSFVIAAEE